MINTIYTANNQKAANIWNRYMKSNCEFVMNAYKTGCSNEKLQAEKDIHFKMFQHCGYNYKIISANTFQFTCGYLVDENTLYVYTANNRYKVVNNGNYEK